MHQIGTSKSILYGITITLIFLISSCEFGNTSTDVSANDRNLLSTPVISNNQVNTRV